MKQNILKLLIEKIILPVTIFSSLAWANQSEEPFYIRSKALHNIQIIQSGPAAMQARLDMIERARSFIYIEYFIYNMDQSARIFTQALIAKKNKYPYMTIRILIDGSPTVYKFDSALVEKLEQAGIEVRVYNPAPLIDFLTTQYRDHRKLLAVDTDSGIEILTGSRNLADEYYDLHSKFNFRDRDIWIKGPLANSIKHSFELYWSHKRTKRAVRLGTKPNLVYDAKNPTEAEQLNYLRKREFAHKIAWAQDFVTENGTDRHIKEQIKKYSQFELGASSNAQGACSDITFVTDEPGFVKGINTISPKRKVQKTLINRISKLNPYDRLTAESPYFIIQDTEAIDALVGIREKHIKATLLTNGLSSTDAFYVAAHFMPRAVFYKNLTGADIFVYSGKKPANLDEITDLNGRSLISNSIFGLHAKTLVFNKQSFAVGTFNLDPRSANINSEMMIICDGSPQLASLIEEDIQNRIKLSFPIRQDGTIEGTDIFTGVSLPKRMAFLLSILPSSLLQILM